MHRTHIVFENLSHLNADMLQKAWGFQIGEDGNAQNKIFSIGKWRQLDNLGLKKVVVFILFCLFPFFLLVDIVQLYSKIGDI